MATSRLGQYMLALTTVLGLSSATSSVLHRRISSLEQKRDLPLASEGQVAFTNGGDDDKIQRLHSLVPSAKVKFYTFDNIWLGGDANDTIVGDEFLQFFHFNLLDAATAVEKGFLNVSDSDCAVSKPNSLHSYPNNFTSPSVIRSNATALAGQGLSEFFDVVAFTWKPIGPTTAYTSIAMDTWKVSTAGEKTATYMDGIFTIWFGDGYIDSDTLVPGEFWEGWGEGVNWVEIESRNGENEPWDFCFDNLVLLFHPKEDDG